MGLRKRHGTAARNRVGSVVEVQPLDEQGPGFQAPLLVEAPGERKANGQLLPGSRTTQSLGGKSRKARIALSADPAIKEALAAAEFRPMLRRGSEFRKAVTRRLAQTVGGGECDELTAAVASIAADQLAASKFFAARAARTLDPSDFLTASRLGDAARQNLIAARELATKHGDALRDAPLLGHAAPVATGTPSRRAELARRLALAPTAAAAPSASSTTENASTHQPDASAHDLEGDPEQ